MKRLPCFDLSGPGDGASLVTRLRPPRRWWRGLFRVSGTLVRESDGSFWVIEVIITARPRKWIQDFARRRGISEERFWELGPLTAMVIYRPLDASNEREMELFREDIIMFIERRHCGND